MKKHAFCQVSTELGESPMPFGTHQQASKWCSAYLENCDAVIVLGGGVIDASKNSVSLPRLREGVKLIMNRTCSKLILAGTEEEIKSMYEKAIELGVDPQVIIKCHPSRTTIGNAYYSKLVADELKLRKLAIVTSEFHMERALAIFRQVFGNNYEMIGKPTPEAPKDAVKREKLLRILIPLLKLFKSGDHETIMKVARVLGIEV